MSYESYVHSVEEELSQQRLRSQLGANTSISAESTSVTFFIESSGHNAAAYIGGGGSIQSRGTATRSVTWAEEDDVCEYKIPTQTESYDFEFKPYGGFMIQESTTEEENVQRGEQWKDREYNVINQTRTPPEPFPSYSVSQPVPPVPLQPMERLIHQALAYTTEQTISPQIESSSSSYTLTQTSPPALDNDTINSLDTDEKERIKHLRWKRSEEIKRQQAIERRLEIKEKIMKDILASSTSTATKQTAGVGGGVGKSQRPTSATLRPSHSTPHLSSNQNRSRPPNSLIAYATGLATAPLDANAHSSVGAVGNRQIAWGSPSTHAPTPPRSLPSSQRGKQENTYKFFY